MSTLRVSLAELAGLAKTYTPPPKGRSLDTVVCASGKDAYTKDEAHAALAHVNRHYYGKMRMRVYLCAFCPHYHIGHRKGRH